MLGWIRRRRQRRRLAPVVSGVPRALQSAFGPSPTYTAAQVESVASRLKLDESQRRAALAACCSPAAFAAARPGLEPGLYDRLRGDIARAFDIDRPKFTCEHLLALRNVPRGAKWQPSAHIYDSFGGYGGSHGTGHESD